MSLALCLLAARAGGAEIEDIVRDTQRMVVNEGQVSMVWWIPQQFWAESFADNKTLPEDVRAQILQVMSNYTVLAVLKGRAVAAQLLDLQSRQDLLKNTHFRVDGKELQALDEKDVQPGVTLLLTQLKPALMQAAGEVGGGLEFLVYPAVKDGMPLIDAERAGTLDISFYGKSFVWHLPLGSLLPPLFDKQSGEMFPPNYLFNPYTGEKLK